MHLYRRACTFFPTAAPFWSAGDTKSGKAGASASTTVNNFKNFVLTGLQANSEVRVYRSSDNVELGGVESSGTSFTYQYNYVSDVAVYYVVFHLSWKDIRRTATLGSSDQTIPIVQIVDREYVNP